MRHARNRLRPRAQVSSRRCTEGALMGTATRIAAVTGGTGGLGDAICRQLAADGYQVVALHTPGNTHVQEWLAAHEKQGLRLDAVAVDVASFASCTAAAATIHERH